jgi:Flp pilus assembly protein TadB
LYCRVGENVPEFFEVCMIISFGLSWPVNIIKSLKARTAKGKSLFFLIFVLFGYLCGIAAKLLAGTINYVLVFYFINFFMVGVDFLLYFRNRILDRQQDALPNAQIKNGTGI